MSRFATIFALCFVLSGCGKQKEGERCQIDDDCEGEILKCSAANTCAVGSTPSIDAAPAIDAVPAIDAPPAIDALPAIDAP